MSVADGNPLVLLCIAGTEVPGTLKRCNDTKVFQNLIKESKITGLQGQKGN